jgi:hypothetical protein
VDSAWGILALFLDSDLRGFAIKIRLLACGIVGLIARNDLPYIAKSQHFVADENSAFPAGMNAAATWSRSLMYARGQAIGAEHRGKGVDRLN